MRIQRATAYIQSFSTYLSERRNDIEYNYRQGKLHHSAMSGYSGELTNPSLIIFFFVIFFFNNNINLYMYFEI